LIKDLLFSVFGGAAAGWVTNSIAVSMLFKKFFGRWGGVIESGYKELIQNLSRLVEQKLINARTLENEIQKQGFNDTLHCWVKEILEKELPAKTEGLRVKDIPGVDQTIERLTSYFEQERAAQSALSGITLSQILSEESYRRIVEINSGNVVSNTLGYKDMAGETLNAFCSGRTFRDIFSESFIRQIKANINEAVKKTDFSQINLDRDFETFTDSIGIDGIIKKIEEAAGEIRIGELASDPCKAARLVLGHIADFLESSPGRDLLHELVCQLTGAAETLDARVCDILHPDLPENLNAFIKRAAPDLVDRLILFIIDSREAIDRLVDEAAAQHFNRDGRVNNPLQAFVFGAVSKHTGFTNKIIEVLSQNRHDAGEKLAVEFTAFIKKTSVGGIVSSLKKSGVINAEIITAAIPVKLRSLRLENSKLFTPIIDAKVKDIFPNIDFSFIKTNIIPHIFGILKEYLQDESKNTRLREKIDGAVDAFAAKDTGGTVDFTKLGFNINETDVKNFMLRRWPDIAGVDASVFFAVTDGTSWWKSITERIKTLKVNGVYNILRNEALYGRAADAAQTFILQNLDTVLCGSIFEIAKNELDVLSPRQVNSVVHNFMGTQLKPINIIGAVLGGLAGALTAAAMLFFRLPPGFLWAMFAVYGLVFALVGIGTNWIAIKMLFRPYKRSAGLNFPPFIGLTALKQPGFAAGIAKFIKQNMLNESALRRFYAEKKDSIHAQCRERFSPESYSFIDDFFSDDNKLAAAVDGILDLLRDYIEAAHTRLAGRIDSYISARIESGGMEGFTNRLRGALFQKIAGGEAAAYTGKMIRRRIEDKSLPEYDAAKIIDPLLNLFYQYIRQNLRNTVSSRTLGCYEAAFNNYIKNHTPADFAGIHDFSKMFVGNISALPQKAAAAIARLAGRQMTDGRRPVKDYLGGAIPVLIKDGIGLVNGMICRLAGSQKQAIVGKIMDDAGGGSFFGRLVKRAANAVMREDVEAITGIVIDEKLFPFLQAHWDSVFGIMDGMLESPSGFECKVFNEKNTERVLSRLFYTDQVLQKVKNLSLSCLNRVSGVKLKNLLFPLNMDTIDGFLERTAPILNAAVSETMLRLDDRATLNRLNKLFNHVISKVFKGRPVSSVLRGIDLEAEAVRISAMFFADGAAVETTKLILDGFLQKILSGKNFYDHSLFRGDVSFFLRNCVNGDSPCVPREQLAVAVRGLFGNSGRLVSADTKDAICGSYLLPAILNACENQFPNLVDSLSLYSVVEREINGMPPQEIEGVFYGFAGPYFKKIILYGWIGLFAGLLSYALGCLPLFLP
jgi:uncharacterized membrane protein YheB (UPF0754 family)